MLIHPTSDNIVAFSTTRDCLSETEVNVPVLLPSHQIHGTKTQIIDREFMEMTQLEQILVLLLPFMQDGKVQYRELLRKISMY